MRQILIQSNLRRRREQEEQNNKISPNIKKPYFKDIDTVHGGHKDRSGFIVFLVLIISTVLAIVLS